MKYYKRKSRKGVISLLLFFLLLSAAINFYYLWPKSAAIGQLTVHARVDYGVYCVGEIRADVCYWFDRQGRLWDEAKTIVGESILKVEEISDFKPVRGQSFLPEQLVANFVKIFDFLKTGYLEVKTISLKREDQELEVLTKTKILFSLRFDSKNNLAGLVAFLKKHEPKELEYIDLRVENKIFYK